uniref:TLDc domain-containing protein n=1 Tax=Rhabditophanes sp. KR3021 TaxID=114890 RepID=A0AC35TVG7_9BILA
MGNNDSKEEAVKRKHHHGNSSSSPQQSFSDGKFEAFYDTLVQKHGQLDEQAFDKIFGSKIGPAIRKYYIGEQCGLITKDEFIKKTGVFFEINHQIFGQIFGDVQSYLDACFDGSNITRTGKDDSICSEIEDNIKAEGSGSSAIIQYMESEFPRICIPLQANIINALSSRPKVTFDFTSSILTEVQMFLLKSALNPIVYLNVKDQDAEKETGKSYWSLLYSSATQGISVNRFENNTFDYKKPSVTILQLNNGQVCVIALDTEWRHSNKKFGGFHSAFIQFKPCYKRINKNESIYCNFKLKSSPMGLIYGNNELNVKGDFSNVDNIEVWGCGDETDLAAQQKQKQWYKNQADKNKKVPLPGNWDENPDKIILGMGGIQLSNERRDQGPDDTIARKF